MRRLANDASPRYACKTGMRAIRLLVLAAGCLCFASGSQAGKPNFVLILGEGQGWNSTSARMDPNVPESASAVFRTPHLARLAEEGMRWTRFYAPSPRCTPSRATYLTGKSPAKLGMTFVTARAGSNPKLLEPEALLELPPRETTVAELLAGAGYVSAHFGKWHVGGIDPSGHGFAESDGATRNGGPDNVQHPNPTEAYGITERAVDFMERQAAAGKPFYLQISHYGGRSAADALEATNEKARGWGIGRSAGAAAVIFDMDTALGAILDKIDELGIAGDTYVFYTTDHGTGGAANGPLAQGKGSVWEGGLRVPFLIRGPGIAPGSVSRTAATGADLVPTLAELAGIDGLPDGLEGGSLTEVLKNGGNGRVERPLRELVFHFPHYDFDPLGPASAIVAGEFKLIRFYESGERLLFDLSKDLGEKRNLAAAMPAKAAELDTRLSAYLQSVGAKLPRENPDYDAAQPSLRRERGAGRQTRRRRASGRRRGN